MPKFKNYMKIKQDVVKEFLRTFFHIKERHFMFNYLQKTRDRDKMSGAEEY